MHLLIFFSYLAIAVANVFSTVRAVHNHAFVGVMIAGTMSLVFTAFATCKFVEIRTNRIEAA